MSPSAGRKGHFARCMSMADTSRPEVSIHPQSRTHLLRIKLRLYQRAMPSPLEENVARPMEVRIYECAPVRSCRSENGWEERFLRSQRIECNRSSSTRGVWVDPGPVVFNKPLVVALQPFASRAYQTLDDLVEEMRHGNYLITDFRKLVGTISNVRQVMPLLGDHVLEDHRGEAILVRRLASGLHESIWLVDEEVMIDLLQFELVTPCADRKSSSYPIVYQRGPHTPESLPKRAARRLHNREAFRERWRVFQETGEFPPAQPLDWPPASESEGSRPSKRRPAKKPRPSISTAHDHDGKPITEQDIEREHNRVPPRGMPRDLIPDVNDDCPDEEFERLMLIEQIKFRRRVEAVKRLRLG